MWRRRASSTLAVAADATGSTSTPSAQLALKVDIVREALRRTAKLPDASVTIGGSVPVWAYRTSMRFAVDGDGRPTLRMARSNDTVSVDHCLIAHPMLVDLLSSLRVRGADEVSLRVGSTSGQRSAWWTPDDIVAAAIPGDVGVGPKATIVEQVAGVDLRVSAASFFQSGPQAAELLVSTVRAVAGDALDHASTVVDAYGGVGLFAACAVPGNSRLVLVEGSSAACRDAQHNLADRPVEVVESKVEEWQPMRADVVIADPSRRGLGAEAVHCLAATEADTLVLISCDPVAFGARCDAVGRSLSARRQRGRRPVPEHASHRGRQPVQPRVSTATCAVSRYSSSRVMRPLATHTRSIAGTSKAPAATVPRSTCCCTNPSSRITRRTSS